MKFGPSITDGFLIPRINQKTITFFLYLYNFFPIFRIKIGELMNRNIKYYFVILFLLGLSLTYAQKVYTPAEAKDHIDETAVIKGEISQVTVTKAGQIYFNMGGKFPNNSFSGVILKNNASKFENVKEFEGKIVEISGKIKLYKDKPEILIEKKEQVVIIPKEETKK